MLRDHPVDAPVRSLLRTGNEGAGMTRSPRKLRVRQSLYCNLVLATAAHEVLWNDSTQAELTLHLRVKQQRSEG